jgi:hypothetical protein
MPSAVAAFLVILTAAFWLQNPTARGFSGEAPLVSVSGPDRYTDVVADSLILDEAAPIEALLTDLDAAPPDWAAIYGTDGGGHDERLFALNRQRDERRRPAERLDRRVTFFWPGEISGLDGASEGFRIAIGPKIIPTRWGLVRFKPENLPGNLLAIPDSAQRERLRADVVRGKRIEVHVAMTGRLVQEESIIYDFAHEEPGRGMVMPVVWVEEIRYVMTR